MNRNRWIQIAAVVCMLAFLLGAALLVRPIRQQRKELQLSLVIDLDREAPPSVVLANAAAGPFRGLAVDYLWYRANVLKEEGKYHEANTLSQWITTLQPQFGQVWSFHAWNMAYNISVATYTPEERWDWVRKGINLLRQKGVLYNQNNPRIYRELGWIFFHKVGQFSDDMHWHYKREMAFDWQSLLGAPNEGATTQQVIDEFRKIPSAPDSLVELAQVNPQAGALADDLKGWGYEVYDPVKDLANEDLLRMFGQLIMFNHSLDAKILDLKFEDVAGKGGDKRLLQVVRDPARAQGLDGLLAFMRKNVLRRNYNMDPAFMLDLMEYDPVNDPDGEDDFGVGPLDWRSPLSHGAYWSAMGVHMAELKRSKKDVDALNMDRQVIHSLQNLTDYGRLGFDPVTRTLDLLPDPRFIPAYDRWWDLAKKRAASGEFGDPTTDSFDSGHENFLLKAIFFSYIYGDEGQAQELYSKVRNLYGMKAHNLRDGRYLQTLPNLVMQYMEENLSLMGNTGAFIDAMLNHAFNALTQNRPDVFTRFVQMARAAHAKFQAKAAVNPNSPQNRMMLLPFDQIVAERFASYMIAPQIHVLPRARAWSATPLPLRQQVWDRIRDDLERQCSEAQLKFATAFPEPEGMEAYRLTQPTDVTKPEILNQEHGRTQRQ